MGEIPRVVTDGADAGLVFEDVVACASGLAQAGDGEVSRLTAALEALARFPDHPAIVDAVARLLLAAGREAAALAAWRRIAAHAHDGVAETAIGERCLAAGGWDEAVGWYRRALTKDPFGIAASLGLIEAYSRLGRGDEAIALLMQIDGRRTGDAALNARWANLLRTNRNAHRSIPRFEEAYAQGLRDEAFLREFIDLLTGETFYARVVALPLFGRPGSALHRYSVRLHAHAKLALAVDREAVLARSVAREQTARWLDVAAVVREIKLAIERRTPLSAIRLGDGEARFIVWNERRYHACLSDEERHVTGDIVWDNWFGEDIATQSSDAMAGLMVALRGAIATADLLGVSSADRLRHDTGHFGYLAAQEDFIDGLGDKVPTQRYFDALGHLRFHQTEPSLVSVLSDLPFLGVISPHPPLAGRLQALLRPAELRSFVVPGETRLATHAALKHASPHFPDMYEKILREVDVPFPGAVYLVGAGLLGKIYCARIKALGGIAIDIGAVVDAWMGVDTRPGLTAAIAAI